MDPESPPVPVDDRLDDRMRLLIEAVPSAMVLVDADGRIVMVNSEAERSFGYSRDELLALQVDHLVPAASRAAHRGYREAYLAHPSRRAMGVGRELYGVRKDGTEMPIEIGLNPITITDRAYVLASIIDITERRRGQEAAEAARQADQLEHILRHDQLTGLPNRTGLLEHLDTLITRTDRRGAGFTLLLLDLDHFSRINDTLGHDSGDDLLLVVAERLRSCVRATDLTARLGGDEFAIAFEGQADDSELTRRIEGLLTALRAPIDIHGYDVAVTASVGATSYPRDGGTPATMLRHADVAMYRAKASGRDDLRWFDNAMVEEVNEKLALSGALRQAIAADELRVVYQPQFDLLTGQLVGFEALARWTSPDLGTVSPDRFIPVAEDSGLILRLGEWVLRTACVDMATLQRALDMPLRLAVNVSPRQLHAPDWCAQVFSALEDAGLEPNQLGLEITEGILLEDNREATSSLHRLRAAGIQVIVDDFGCGYSSLAYLTRFPVDKIKIDRSFVAPISSVDDDAAVVDAIIGMAHALGMVVVAEGVESAEQEQYLRARGCDEVQGFRYGRGLAVGDAADMRRTWTVGQ
ncbi:putative bifunctional diguanylate cyclase/phosphodiesterase [Nocardioides montaniterrae]